MTTLYEGEMVTYTGVGMPPAQGELLAVSDSRSVHVMWTTGSRAGMVDIVDSSDLARVESPTRLAELKPMSTTAVRQCMDSAGPEAVLTFLASAQQLDTWPELARNLLAEAKSKLLADASMGMVWEQLDRDEVDAVVHTAAVVLLRDAFTHDNESDEGLIA